MFKGTTRVTRKGEKGEDTITELVTYIDGQRVTSQEVSRVRTKEPVTEKKLIGTKSTRVSGGYNVKVPDAALYGLHPRVHSSARLTAGEPCAVTEISTPVSTSLFPAAVRPERS